jgi:hypothetical protein
MKKYIIGLLFILLITSCSSATATEQSSLIIEGPTDSVSEMTDAQTAAEKAAINQLSINLEMDPASITIVSSETVEFNDSCMGVVMQNVACAEAIMPGRIVVLESDGVQYEYHVSEDGNQVQPATLALTWQREGGFAGFCDSMTVFLSGEIYGSNCKSQPSTVISNFAQTLTAVEVDQFDTWMNDYGQFTLDASDPKGTADGMAQLIELYGLEKGKPAKPVQEEIFLWAQNVYAKLFS